MHNSRKTHGAKDAADRRARKTPGKILSVKIPPEKIASAEATTNKRYQGIIKAAG